MSERFLNYGRQFIDEDDFEAVLNVLRGDFLTQGPAVELFEKSLCEYTGAKYTVVVSSGTAALHVASLSAGMAQGDTGITSTLTFVASANAFMYCGGSAHAIDIDAYSLAMDPRELEKALADKPQTKVITPVHFAGLACDTAVLRDVAGSRVLIEDASHSLGGMYEDGTPVGNGAAADMTVFSFHPVKPVTTGEGGAITTNDANLYRRLKMFANHGIERNPDLLFISADELNNQQMNPWYYEQQELGFNYRMSDIHAALGNSQLKKLGNFIARRRHIAAMYDEAFSGNSAIKLAQSDPNDRKRSAHHLYVTEIDFAGLGMTRKAFVEKLKAYNVGGQIHYIPIHRQPYQQKNNAYETKNFPVAEAYYSKCLSLPIHAGLTDVEVNRVIDAIGNVIENRSAA